MSVRFRAVLSLLLALVTLCALIPCASATEDTEWPSAEVAIQDLMNEYEVDESYVALAYYNTVTGEEYYLNPDQYMDAASMYKVPLNMIFAERVANGELDPDGNIGLIPYRTLMEETIINSDNDMAAVLIAQFSSYHEYRRAIAPYMGVDPDNVDNKYYENNFFTPRQMLTCLKLLYNEQDRFPSIIETMQKATPNLYFCRDEHRYTIAHKYGWNDEENGVLHINDCAIISTPDPIIIVLFTTSGVNGQEDFISAFCTRCIDYTESATEARLAAEEAERQAQETAAAKQAEEDAQKAAETQAEQVRIEAEMQTAAAQQAAEVQNAQARGETGRIIVILAALGFACIASLILFIRHLRAGKHADMLPYLALFALAFVMLIYACRIFFF